MALHDLFAATFPALALAHGAALLSPGPDFFLIAGYAVRHGFRGSAGICMGIASANALYIMLALAGWSGLRDHTQLYHVIEFAGAAWLVWLGFMLVRSGRHPAQTVHEFETRRLSFPAQFVAGFFSAILNPKNAVFYLTLMTAILGQEATFLQQSVAGAWMAMLVLTWDMGLAALFSARGIRQRWLSRIHRLEMVSGLVLVGLACGLLFAPFLEAR